MNSGVRSRYFMVSAVGSELTLDLFCGQQLEAVRRVAAEAVLAVHANCEVTLRGEEWINVDCQEGFHCFDALFHGCFCLWF